MVKCSIYNSVSGNLVGVRSAERASVVPVGLVLKGFLTKVSIRGFKFRQELGRAPVHWSYPVLLSDNLMKVCNLILQVLDVQVSAPLPVGVTGAGVRVIRGWKIILGSTAARTRRVRTILP